MTSKFGNPAEIQKKYSRESELVFELEQYDLSFAYSFNWDKEEHIREALKVLLCNKDVDQQEPNRQKTMVKTKKSVLSKRKAQHWKRLGYGGYSPSIRTHRRQFWII
jgi:hypothetical protein